jgi:CRISPR type IV-associated protein Csf2
MIEERKMDRVRYEFVLEAETPIAHASETVGNHSHLMTRRIRTTAGFEDVPCITADTMRHKLREASALALLDAAGMREGLTESALRLLFNGGVVTGGDGGAVKLDAFREMVELVPSLALFGGCAQNRIVPGRLFVEDALLICKETARYIQPWQLECAEQEFPLDTFTSHVEEAQRVRMDVTLNPHMRQLMSGEAQIEVNKRLEAGEKASEAKDSIEKHEAKSTMMPRTFDRIATGSLFAWSCEAQVSTDLDRDVFLVAILAFISRAVVGGKSGTGHGRLRVVKARDIQIASPSRDFEAFDATQLAPRVGQLFRSHVEQRKERIRDFFRDVVA